MRFASNVYELCHQCEKSKVSLQNEMIRNVNWDMTREEWNEGKISLDHLLKKGTVNSLEYRCDQCQTTTTHSTITTATSAPLRLFINISRRVNMLDRDVANAAYFIHDAENHSDVITYTVTCPKVLEYNVKVVDDNQFHDRQVRYSLLGVICVTIQEEEPLKCHYDCHCVNEEGKWVHYDDYVSKDSDLIKDDEEVFDSNSVCGLFYKRLNNV